MNIPKRLWRETDIGHFLNLFPGEFGEILQHTTPQEIVRAQQFLPFIFWRWYFMRLEVNPQMTPYENLSRCRQFECWPDTGQFFPQATMTVTGGKLKIDVSVDYIASDEQPFVTDLQRAMEGKPLAYPFSNCKYAGDIQFLATGLKGQKITGMRGDAYADVMARVYVEHTLTSWYNADEIVRGAFSRKSWISFWKDVIKDAGRTHYGYDTKPLLDEFIPIVRKTIPDYGMTNAELEAYKIEGDEYPLEKQLAAYHVWSSATYYVFLPLSLYWHLFMLIFGERANFPEDVGGLLSEYTEEPTMLYSPCSWVGLTPFGHEAFSTL